MKLGRYRYYKGKEYQVLGVALDVITQKKVVLYKALYQCPDLADEYGEYPTFTRPYDSFHEDVIVDGKAIARFEYMGT